MAGHITNDSDAPTDWRTVQAGELMDPPCTGLLLDQAGTLEVETVAGTTLTMPMQAGYNPGRFVRVNSGYDFATLTIRAAFYRREDLEN